MDSKQTCQFMMAGVRKCGKPCDDSLACFAHKGRSHCITCGVETRSKTGYCSTHAKGAYQRQNRVRKAERFKTVAEEHAELLLRVAALEKENAALKGKIEESKLKPGQVLMCVPHDFNPHEGGSYRIDFKYPPAEPAADIGHFDASDPLELFLSDSPKANPAK